MLDESESLDVVFSFLSQIDLPPGLTALEDEGLNGQEVLAPSPTELFASPAEAIVSFETLLDVPLDAFSTDDSSVRFDSTGVTSPTASSDDSSKGEADNKPKRVRISQKKQIETLRATIRELNAELQSLLPQWKPSSGTLVRGDDGQLVPRRASMWEEIAARQLQRRLQSEEENKKLRDMLQIQLHEARNLKRVLKRRTKIDMMEDMFGMKRCKMLEDGYPEDNAQVFEDMLRDVDELYVGTDALFAEKGLYDLPCPGRHRNATRNVTNGAFLELMERRLVPFDIRTTEKAMYKTMRRISFQGLRKIEDFQGRVQFRSHHIEELSNTIKTSFLVETTDLGNVKGAQFRQVVRKYVEKDQVVFICKMLMEPVIAKVGKASGFLTRTTLRIILREETPQSAKEKPVTRIDSLFTATRFDQGLQGARGIRNSPNLDLGIAVWDEAISRIAYQVESLAIDDSSRKLSSPPVALT
ncbi:Protein kinase [Phytophthora cinnamomi]|uniref:Protein kinase n=1 Tax=Phytophthora cinnamomi TaxID=4785 RepID=UPI003559ACAE|nr:Protein kinase [Phytophthora cinnamomi]